MKMPAGSVNLSKQSFLLVLIASLAMATTAAIRNENLKVTPFFLPGVSRGVGFDDLRFSSELGRILVPGGRTGSVFLIDPKSRKTAIVGGFSKSEIFAGGHGQSTTSVDFGDGYLFAIDRTAGVLVAIDPKSGSGVAKTPLASGPDYVRYVKTTGEVWVTEPDEERIEVFSFNTKPSPRFTAKSSFKIRGGPESLVIDDLRSRAYTHLWGGKTVSIDLKSKAVLAQWLNGCKGSRGIALDEERGLLFAGCAEGKAVVLDVKGKGDILSDAFTGEGVDIIAYSQSLEHLYLPGGRSATMTIVGVSAGGRLDPLGTVETSKDAHCVVADENGGAWICDPDHGRLLYLADPYPAEMARRR